MDCSCPCLNCRPRSLHFESNQKLAADHFVQVALGRYSSHSICSRHQALAQRAAPCIQRQTCQTCPAAAASVHSAHAGVARGCQRATTWAAARRNVDRDGRAHGKQRHCRWSPSGDCKGCMHERTTASLGTALSQHATCSLSTISFN